MSLAQHGRHFCQARVCLPLKPERQELRAKTHVSHPGHRPWLEDWPGWPVAMCLINSNWLCVEQSLSKESQRFAKLREKQKEHYAVDETLCVHWNTILIRSAHVTFNITQLFHCPGQSTAAATPRLILLLLLLLLLLLQGANPNHIHVLWVYCCCYD